MKNILLSFLFVATVCSASALASGFGDAKDPYNKTFITAPASQPNYVLQYQMRNSAPWLSFKNSHPTWSVEFDEFNAMPHRAYGKGIYLPYNGSAVDKAMNFIATDLSAFNIPVNELELRHASSTSKYQYIDFYQTYQSLEVLNSRVTVRMTNNNEVVLFGADVFNNIQISTQPSITESAVSSFATSGIAYIINQIVTEPTLKILPVPSGNSYSYHLVYVTMIYAIDNDGYPANYYTLTDANSGEVLYRVNTVHNCFDEMKTDSKTFSDNNKNSITPTVTLTKHEGESVPIDILVEGTVSVFNPYITESVEPIRNLRVNVQGIDFFTDSTGYIHLPNTSTVNGTVYMQGTWSQVVQGNTATTISNFSVSLSPGLNTISLDANTNDRERSAYYHVNVVHDFMKLQLPNFTGLDTDLPTRVERTDGNCNAFYDGASINFYTHNSGCYALSLCGDVVYHEYGHGIDDLFYTSQGGNWQNGAMSEGYSDVWALSITNNPLLGIGISDVDPNTVVRRYDINKKVYPQDIQGEPHADGEIICGAWWDTRLNIGGAGTDSMVALFRESLFGLANGPDGTEGTVFRDVLLDCLMADDDNGNINDGTPHDVQILTAFALHGITLMANIDLQHTEPVIANFNVPLTISADVVVDFPLYLGDIDLHYKADTASIWNSTTMTLQSGNTYDANIAAQTQGSILDYYFTVKDIFGNVATTIPAGVIDTPYHNVPYKLMVGFVQLLTQDFDNTAGNWQVDVNNTDDATTGIWILDSPNATFLTAGNPSSMVQTGTDHTANNNFNFCYFTGNGTTPTSIGENDVDGGRTSLFSPVFDLSTYDNPAISFYQWYSNEMGANPRNDQWRIYITNDQSTWQRLEFTNYPDRQWRDYAFRVTDYVAPTSTVQLMFIASDSIIPGMGTTNGGSVVEAAIDDLIIWEEGIPSSATTIMNENLFSVFPNPSNGMVTMMIPSELKNKIITVTNCVGERVKTYNAINSTSQKLNFNFSDLDPGIYFVQLQSDSGNWTRKLSILK